MMLAPFNLLLACHLFLTCTALRGTFSNSFFADQCVRLWQLEQVAELQVTLC